MERKGMERKEEKEEMVRDARKVHLVTNCVCVEKASPSLLFNYINECLSEITKKFH